VITQFIVNMFIHLKLFSHFVETGGH
jgi:hypothetical protein